MHQVEIDDFKAGYKAYQSLSGASYLGQTGAWRRGWDTARREHLAKSPGSQVQYGSYTGYGARAGW